MYPCTHHAFVKEDQAQLTNEQVVFYNPQKLESQAELFNRFSCSLSFLDLMGILSYLAQEMESKKENNMWKEKAGIFSRKSVYFLILLIKL